MLIYNVDLVFGNCVALVPPPPTTIAVPSLYKNGRIHFVCCQKEIVKIKIFFVAQI